MSFCDFVSLCAPRSRDYRQFKVISGLESAALTLPFKGRLHHHYHSSAKFMLGNHQLCSAVLTSAVSVGSPSARILFAFAVDSENA